VGAAPAPSLVPQQSRRLWSGRGAATGMLPAVEVTLPSLEQAVQISRLCSGLSWVTTCKKCSVNYFTT